ncbi:MAG TPA: prepilin-type N-terminal cleavage/methylation domain-containing protein [Opitutaceae bacterium]|nr:prepilin-type N-terminal cleavage/methylation domain-containing protein [Opitutaceae bacterium]
MPTFNRRQAMTLVELMVAMSIGLIVTTGTLRFLIQTLKTYQYETGKLLINRDIRKFTTEMLDDATYANGFQIYDQCANLDRTGYSAVNSANPASTTYEGYGAALTVTEPDDPVSATAPGTEKVASGLPGDVLVFIYNKDGDNTKIEKLIIYYRVIATTANGSGGTNSTTVSNRTVALKRLVVNITNTTAQSAGIMKLLPALTSATAGRTIFPYVDGQAHDTANSVNRVNKMFYNLNNTSVIVRGSIYENYTAQRVVKSTYNFTVTPRG